MGTRVPCPPPEYGIDCPRCTPALWAVGETPLVIYAYCSGFITCPPNNTGNANGMTFACVQTVGNICEWQANYGDWILEYFPDKFGSGDSFIQLIIRGIVHLRVDNGPVCPPEFHVFHNPVPACVPFGHVASGTITIFWNVPFVPPAEGLGSDCIPDLMMEWFNHPDGDVVKKFTNLYLRANLRVKVTP